MRCPHCDSERIELTNACGTHGSLYRCRVCLRPWIHGGPIDPAQDTAALIAAVEAFLFSAP